MPSFGFGYRFSRRQNVPGGNPGAGHIILYGPKIGPKGPKQMLFGFWNQAPVGYCYETNNTSEDLYAKWASRGINCVKAGHPDFPAGNAAALLAATQANNLMLLAAPRWSDQFFGFRPDPSVLDFRDLAINDPYWRTNWIAYSIQDEQDLTLFPLSDHVTFLEGHVLDGVTKPGFANFTRRLGIPAGAEASPSIIYREAVNVPSVKGLSIDSYEWHIDNTDLNSATAVSSSPQIFTSTWHGAGIYDEGLPAPLNFATRIMVGRRFTASLTGMCVDLLTNGPFSPGRSDTGTLPVQYPPSYFNTPPFATYGDIIVPIENDYAPGDKWTGHYVSTSRVEITPDSYGRGGQWQPGRFLRNESWSGFVHGSSALFLFPQTVGSTVITGYIDTVANTLVITSEPVRPFLFGGALRINVDGDFTLRGWVRRDNPQLSGTPGGAGAYALDVTKATPVATGSAGTPVAIRLFTAAGPIGDDTNAENASELATIIANANRMQAHPTGGNLLIDTVNGGRRAFTVMRCPDIDADVSLYREDMTLAPMQAGYTVGGTPILDDAGRGPQWEFGWPMGFEGFRVVGDDGATYIYVRSLSNSNRPTWFPGYAALGLEARVYRAFELVGFRRVGTGTAVEMTGSSAVLKAGVDDGPATWFYIETAAITQNEGNSGSTAYAITVRRGGNLSVTSSVTASVSGTGINPANPTDFAGGVFPSQVLTFAPTEQTKVFTVNIRGEVTAEQDETFKVSLSAPSTGTAVIGSNRGEMTCTIANDDAAVAGAFIWLGSTLSGAPALPGSPPSAVHLNAGETANVTRGGVTMRSTASFPPTSDSGGFASTPFWQLSGTSVGIRFELPAGSWELAVIATQTFGNNSGTVQIIDDPAGTAIIRQTLPLSFNGGLLGDTDGTTYTNAATALADCVNNLTYVPLTVTDLGSGTGVVKVQMGAGLLNITAVALRQV